MSRYAGRHRRVADSRSTRRAATLGLLATTTLAAVMFLPAAPVAAQAPDVTAWWNAANVGDPAPVPPPPPDVKSGDLLVQGSNEGPAGDALGLGVAPVTTQAIAGVSFDLPTGALVGALTLPIDGTPPPAVSIVACRATETFTSDENGAWSQVPSYDANACVSGELKGTNVVFAQVSKLVESDKLAVLLLPGPLDRVVFAPPKANALAVRSGGGVGAAAPPVGAGVGSTTTSTNGAAPPPRSSGGSAPGADVPPVADLPATGATSAGADQPPVVAQPAATSPATQPVAAVDNGMSTQNRRIIGLLIIAAEVVGYLLLRRAPTSSATAAGATAVAGGRLRPPDRRAGGLRAGPDGGVGRFRRERSGVVPHL